MHTVSLSGGISPADVVLVVVAAVDVALVVVVVEEALVVVETDVVVEGAEVEMVDALVVVDAVVAAVVDPTDPPEPNPSRKAFKIAFFCPQIPLKSSVSNDQIITPPNLLATAYWAFILADLGLSYPTH